MSVVFYLAKRHVVLWSVYAAVGFKRRRRKKRAKSETQTDICLGIGTVVVNLREMSKWLGRIAGLFSNRSMVGKDKAGNRYFTRIDEIDGAMKEKRWVVFKGEEDPTSVPVEWISWLNGQRKKAPTPEEMIELEARRERVRQNVALLKKEEEERKAREGSTRRVVSTGRAGGPDLKSFIRQFPVSSEGDKHKQETNETRTSKEKEAENEKVSESTEPTGSGQTFKPGTWQPPT